DEVGVAQPLAVFRPPFRLLAGLRCAVRIARGRNADPPQIVSVLLAFDANDAVAAGDRLEDLRQAVDVFAVCAVPSLDPLSALLRATNPAPWLLSGMVAHLLEQQLAVLIDVIVSNQRGVAIGVAVCLPDGAGPSAMIAAPESVPAFDRDAKHLEAFVRALA